MEEKEQKKGTPLDSKMYIPVVRQIPARLNGALNDLQKLVDQGLSYDEVVAKADKRIILKEDVDEAFRKKSQKDNKEEEKELNTSNEQNETKTSNVNNEEEVNNEIKDKTEKENEIFTTKQSEENIEKENNNGKEIMLDMEKIRVNPEQARKDFNENAIKELADSIKEYGLLQPILVSKNENEDSYEIVAGERRYRACELLNKKEIKAVVINEDNEERLTLISLIENMQREDLSPVEKAMALSKAMNDFSLTQEELAKKLGKARSTIANMVRILDLDERVLDLFQEKKLSYKQCILLLSIKDKEEQYKKALELINKENSSENSEKESKAENEEELPEIYKQIQSNFQKIFGEDLKFKAKPKTKTVTFKFKTDEEVEKFLQLLQK